MSIWAPREESLKLLAGPLAEDAQIVDDALAALEETISEFQAQANSPRARLTGLLLAKAQRLAIGTYSMALDCVGQESGALIRPLQEVYELLEYIRLDASRVDKIIDGTPPKAGAVAKAIQSNLHDLRKYLNEHASHVSFSFEALGHLVDLTSGQIRTLRGPGEGRVLQTNLVTLGAIINLVVNEALLTLDAERPGTADRLFASHEQQCVRARTRAAELGLFSTTAGEERTGV